MRWAKRSRSLLRYWATDGRIERRVSAREFQVKREGYDGRMDGWVDKADG